MKRQLLCLFAALILLTALVPLSTSSSMVRADETPVTIGVSVPSIEFYYEELTTSAVETAGELNAEVMILSSEGDLDAELSNVEQFIADGVDAILFNPVDAIESAPAIQAANEANIPVFLIGEMDYVAGEDLTIAGYIKTDEFAAGEQGAELICQAVAEDATVVELVGYEADAAMATDASEISTTEDEMDAELKSAAQERSEGFNSYLQENCPAIIVVPLVAVGLESEEISTAFVELLSTNTVSAVYSYNADSVIAAMEAALASRNLGIIFVGFDATEDTLAAIQLGRLQAVLVDQPAKLGVAAVELIVDFLNGEDVPAIVRVEAGVIDGSSVASARCLRGCKR